MPEVKRPNLKRWTVGGLLFVGVAWTLNLLALGWLSPEQRGTYGDMFGAVNAVFSGLAFLGVIIAILMQRDELRLQRRDLGYQRTELELTRAELKSQTEALKRQSFEATFFQLLRLHNELVESVTLLPRGQKIFGRFAFTCYWNYTHENKEPEERTLESHLDTFRETVQPATGHYFRNLYNIVRFVDAHAEPESKLMYMRLVRAQLSRHEALLLAVNCLSEFGREKFKPLVEKYALLHGIEDHIPEVHREQYAKSAFGSESDAHLR